MKDQFISAYQANIIRPGADKFLNWLEMNTDFFTAPASTSHHLACKGGLVEHSVHVYERLLGLITLEQNRNASFKVPSSETLAIVSLLHDVCKTNFYQESTRNVKENGLWVVKPYYIVKDQFPYGHGEKSVFLIERFMRLTIEEATAIRFHMGAFSVPAGDYSQSQAFYRYPLATLTHLADMEATYLDERE